MFCCVIDISVLLFIALIAALILLFTYCQSTVSITPHFQPQRYVDTRTTYTRSYGEKITFDGITPEIDTDVVISF